MSPWTRWIFFLIVLAVPALAFWFTSGPGASSVATWQPDGPVDPVSTRLALLVNENECASGATATGRIKDPDVEYRAESVVITIRVEQRGGDQDCQGNPDTPFVLNLDEPVGNRQLLDGGRRPPAPPNADR
jgi:hypothetical protein